MAVEASKNDDVHFLTGVTDEQLVALYRNAAVFLFPSLYEGFGIPPLEAMRLGCPVVATNAAAVPDTVGDAAILVDPRDVSSISEALLRVLSDDAIRDEIIERGHKRAEAFTWSKSGELLYRLIAQLS
ncbi:D-inositol 3-phosphate glycosyltransferase [compost metagenome]